MYHYYGRQKWILHECYLQFPLKGIETKSIKIMDWGEKTLRNKRIPLVRVLWRNSQIEKETWERESEIKEK
jgi:hypothetical protein